ncbi:MAG: DUF3604 domain-containing protein [Verrucomicrobia bacterium]|nr:DUF3604 domain-containing protein [Verrucomicrobiota bacterium]
MPHPVEFSAYLATRPFLGRATLSRHEVVAGEWLELLATYEVGAAGLADGAWLKLVFKFYSDWGLFQTSDPAAANYLTAEYLPREPFRGESPATVRSLKVRFDQKGHERPYQKAVIVDVVDGYLKPGDRIVLRLGDRRFGGPGTRAQTFVEEAFLFRLFVDTVGASKFAAVPGEMPLRILAGPGLRDSLLAPRLVRPGVGFGVTFRREDSWGNLAAADHHAPALEVYRGDEERPCLVRPLRWGGPDGAWAREELFLPEQAGDYRLVAGAAVAWVTVAPSAPTPRALYADLHIHSDDTVGVNPTRSVLNYARDAAGLDIAGYTANDFNVRADRWAAAVAVCRDLHEEDRFLCFPGTEWCGASAVGGDRNVVFLGDEVRFPLAADGRSLRVFDWNEDTAKGRPQDPGLPTAANLHDAYRDLAEGDRALLIPHVGGRRALFEWHDPALERLVEVASSWGHFDWFYRDALARGLLVGASAAGDEHRGRPGGGAPGVGSFGTAGGLTGVLADTVTREAVAKALRARHTWATTGGRAVALLQAGSFRQGDAFEHTGPLRVDYALYAEQGWERVELRDDQGAVLLLRDLDAELGYAPGRVRIRWGGARIRDRYRWAEWHATVRIEGAGVREWRARGLEHAEETVAEIGHGIFAIRTDTYGDADHLELDLTGLADAVFTLNFEIDAYNKTGDALARNPDPVTPGVAFTVTGAELLASVDGGVRRELGGAELFVAVERLTDLALPRTLTGACEVSPGQGPAGHRAVYLFARERSDAKVWSSPLFVTFHA